jgi:recombination protein RecT
MTKDLTVQQYVKSPDVMRRINDLLKDRAGDFIISLSSITNQNSLLAKCDPQSLVMGALTATAMRLPINPNLGFCYLIPYKNKDDSYTAQLQLGWKSFVQLAMRSNQFKTINVSDVREGEILGHDRLSGDIKFGWVEENREKLPVVGYVAYMALTNGFTKSLYMTVQELNTHSHKYSQTAKKGFGMWIDDFDSMACKTVIKLLLSKYAPLTT